MSTTTRPWGYYKVLHDVEGCKVKELVVQPYLNLSMQKHFKRSELWLVVKGQCVVQSITDSGYFLPSRILKQHDWLIIDKGEWHQLDNPFDQPCHLVEIQFGQECIEEDIERIFASEAEIPRI